jgi:hypothetical protein
VRTGTSSLAISDPAVSRSRSIKSTRRWPPGSIQHWTLPVLSRLSKHFPAAIDRIGEIVRDPEHKDNFAACRLVVESLIRDGKVRGPIDAGVKITIELAETGKKEERVIEHEEVAA